MTEGRTAASETARLWLSNASGAEKGGLEENENERAEKILRKGATRRRTGTVLYTRGFVSSNRTIFVPHARSASIARMTAFLGDAPSAPITNCAFTVVGGIRISSSYDLASDAARDVAASSTSHPSNDVGSHASASASATENAFAFASLVAARVRSAPPPGRHFTSHARHAVMHAHRG